MSNGLVKKLSPAFILPDHVNEKGHVTNRNASKVPYVHWPNKAPCYEANAWMLHKWKTGNIKHARRDDGGTLRTYGSNISHLLRFCYDNRIELSDLTDNTFKLFMQGLQAEKNENGKLTRQSNQVLAIGRKCIEFLVFVGELSGNTSLIGECGCQIEAYEYTYQKPYGKRGKTKAEKYWTHASFPGPSPKIKKLPVSKDVVQRLKDECKNEKDKGLRLRDELMIACFEQSPGRRFEVCELKVEDFINASNSIGSPVQLKMYTAKTQEDEADRFVPVPRAFINKALHYIRVIRRPLIRQKLGASKDHGYLFVSHTQATQVAVGFFNQRLTTIATRAGIAFEPYAPHLWRHAYITQKFIIAIESYDLENQDAFRKALLSTSKLKMDLQQWTGHKDIGSLDHYIDCAFNEITQMGKIYDQMHLAASVGIIKDELESIMHQMSKATRLTEVKESTSRLFEITETFKEELELAALKRKS